MKQVIEEKLYVENFPNFSGKYLGNFPEKYEIFRTIFPPHITTVTCMLNAWSLFILHHGRRQLFIAVRATWDKRKGTVDGKLATVKRVRPGRTHCLPLL
jgi:hypothetical protein